MSLDRPTFMSRDYGDRTIPAEAEVASQGDEEDVTVWTWRDDEMVYLQQGYDLIVIPLEAIEKLAGARREGALRAALEGIRVDSDHYREAMLRGMRALDEIGAIRNSARADLYHSITPPSIAPESRAALSASPAPAPERVPASECARCRWPLGYGPATHRYLHGHDFVPADLQEPTDG